MEQIKVIQENASILNLQKLRVSDDLFPPTNQGKIAMITTSNHTVHLCQIFIDKTIHPGYCHMDSSIFGYDPPDPKGRYPPKTTVETIKLSDINILSSVNNIKSLTVSVVFNTPSIANKWSKGSLSGKLIDLLKNILKLFVLKKSCVVDIDGLKGLFDSDIHCLLVDSIGNIDVGRVVSSTKVRISVVISIETFKQIYTYKDDTSRLGGLEEPVKTFKELVMLNAASKNEAISEIYKQVLLVGPTGCGKTCLVHQVSRQCGAVLKTVVGPELSSPLPGDSETALTAVFDECKLLASESPGGCVLLLDQVESLCGRQGSSKGGHVVRLANQLYRLLESVNTTPGLMVVGTTCHPQALDPAVRRPGRFDHEIHISVSGEAERVSIVSELSSQRGLYTSQSLCGEVGRWTPGFVGADIALLVNSVAHTLHRLCLPLNFAEEEDLLSHWQACVTKIQPSALKGQLGVMRKETMSFSDLGGVDRVKRCLIQAIQWPLSHPEVFTRMGLPNPKGVLLYGPPGCAKTSLARAVAAATHTTFLAVSAAEVYSPYVGDAERTIAELFHRARIAAPSILFIDEIDALVGCRGDRERGAQERILTAFLTEMDGVGVRLDSGTSQSAGVVVVAATNRPDMLDPALKRPGRFDRLVYVGPPDADQRLDILRTLTRQMPLGADVDLSELANNTELFSGADLGQLCKEAGLCALTQDGMLVKEIRRCHWLSALRDTRPSLSREQIEHYEQMALAGD